MPEPLEAVGNSGPVAPGGPQSEQKSFCFSPTPPPLTGTLLGKELLLPEEQQVVPSPRLGIVPSENGD